MLLHPAPLTRINPSAAVPAGVARAAMVSSLIAELAGIVVGMGVKK